MREGGWKFREGECECDAALKHKCDDCDYQDVRFNEKACIRVK